ncbi:MAG: Anthranilate phosphoribosyltransferase [Alphaproteobacteria bacterium MarineAlpha5_Bin9]|nr:MAG: Anthranilate phosphoribosyltransferase [Alphaproteobacteria bacterium MarineAlpha5_Bin9]|tara:strand:+ start:5757 stop:6752 length:996 start_codon:yes stop_codon:yes gene_type:complete
MIVRDIKNKIFNCNNLSLNESKFIFNKIMEGKLSEIDISAILIGLKIKKEKIEEILGAVEIMREKSLKIKAPENSIDTCGTGGDMKGTINISTISAIVAASSGIPVAKHGNRSISSKSGSADFLEKLGYKISSEKKIIEELLIKNNFCFMFAQYHHEAMKHVINVRKSLETRTIFNLLGPLTNPASAKKQIIGVYDEKLTNTFSEVLKRLGSIHSLIVHGKEGLDEISLSGPSIISELKNDKINNFIFKPQDYGYELINIDDIRGGDAEYNVKKFYEMLDGKNKNLQKIIEINAGAAIYVSGTVKSLQEGFLKAKFVLDNNITKSYLPQIL